MKAHDPLDDIRTAAPCAASWDAMSGDARVRHCTLCDLNVYNFAEMTREEIRGVIARSEGRLCARLYRRADGTLLTRDCPSAFRALKQRASRLAAAVLATLFSASVFADGAATCEKRSVRKYRGKTTVDSMAITAGQPMLTGAVVLDGSGEFLPGVTVTVKEEGTGRVIATVATDSNGAFNIAVLPDGTYRLEVALVGFEASVVEHVRLDHGRMTRAYVTLRMAELMGEVLVGAVSVADPITTSVSTTVSTTFYQDLINKLPI